MVYLDNSATTHKKPKSVIDSMTDYLSFGCANPGRSGHYLSEKIGDKIYECRNRISKMFGVKTPENVIFTSNATEGLNMAIKGFLKRGDHAIVSSMEHNSVIRPINSVKDNGVEFSVAKGDVFGRVTKESVLNEIKPNTKLVCLIHASNVCGTVNDIREIGKVLNERKITFLVDASQSAGIIDINMERDCVDILVLTGHKALYGPQGTGAICFRNNINIKPLKEGGTGSMSKLDRQPDFLPDKHESGTLNAVGIVGLNEGIKFINKVGLENIQNHDKYLTQILLEDLSVIRDLKIFGYLTTVRRIGVVSFNSAGRDVTEIAEKLNSEYNICVRAGYHCAYGAHQTIGSEKDGTVRISLGAFNSINDIKYAVNAINRIIN